MAAGTVEEGGGCASHPCRVATLVVAGVGPPTRPHGRVACERACTLSGLVLCQPHGPLRRLPRGAEALESVDRTAKNLKHLRHDNLAEPALSPTANTASNPSTPSTASTASKPKPRHDGAQPARAAEHPAATDTAASSHIHPVDVPDPADPAQPVQETAAVPAQSEGALLLPSPSGGEEWPSDSEELPLPPLPPLPTSSSAAAAEAMPPPSDQDADSTPPAAGGFSTQPTWSRAPPACRS
jgi:hypothetical protein